MIDKNLKESEVLRNTSVRRNTSQNDMMNEGEREVRIDIEVKRRERRNTCRSIEKRKTN
jgi:hypothetical protein